MGTGAGRRVARKLRTALHQGNVLQRVEKMIESGVYEEPLWYEAAKENPPLVTKHLTPIVKKTLVFPTDELVKEFQFRNPQVMDEPMSDIHAATPSLSFQFACKQYDLMLKGMAKEDAYDAAMEQMKDESESKIRSNRRLIESARAVAGTGATPSFFADRSIFERLLEWKDMMSEKPFELWDDSEKAGLMNWITCDVMRYGFHQLKAARSMKDGTMEEIEANAMALLHALFPGSIFNRGRIPMRYRFDDPKWLRDHQMWSMLVRKKPRAYLWDLETRSALSDWILKECFESESVGFELYKVLYQERANELVWEVHLAKLTLFPGIRLHKLQTSDPIPQPNLIDGVPSAENIILMSEVINKKVVPHRNAHPTFNTGPKDDPKYGFASAGIVGGGGEQAMMEMIKDDNVSKIKDKYVRNRMELFRRETMNPVEGVLVEAARRSRRIQAAADAAAFDERRLLRTGVRTALNERFGEIGGPTIFEDIEQAQVEKNVRERSKFRAEKALQDEEERLSLEAKRRRRAARLEREARWAAEKAERERLEALEDTLPQLIVPRKDNRNRIRF